MLDPGTASFTIGEFLPLMATGVDSPGLFLVKSLENLFALGGFSAEVAIGPTLG